MSAMERNALCPQVADCRSSSSSTERPLNHTPLPSRCEGQVSGVELPIVAREQPAVVDPEQPHVCLEGGLSWNVAAAVMRSVHREG